MMRSKPLAPHFASTTAAAVVAATPAPTEPAVRCDNATNPGAKRGDTLVVRYTAMYELSDRWHVALDDNILDVATEGGGEGGDSSDNYSTLGENPSVRMQLPGSKPAQAAAGGKGLLLNPALPPEWPREMVGMCKGQTLWIPLAVQSPFVAKLLSTPGYV